MKVAGINTDGQATAMADIPSNNWVRVASGGKAYSPPKREQTTMKKDNAAWETLKGNDSGQAYRNSLAYKKTQQQLPLKTLLQEEPGEKIRLKRKINEERTQDMHMEFVQWHAQQIMLYKRSAYRE